jgi:hypothetical protein
MRVTSVELPQRVERVLLPLRTTLGYIPLLSAVERSAESRPRSTFPQAKAMIDDQLGHFVQLKTGLFV